MKKLMLLAPLALAASCGSTGGTEWVDYGDNPMTSPEYMAAMMAAGTPGDAHAELAKGAGTWKVVSQWWPYPGGEAMTMEAMAEVSMMFDRHMVMEFSSDFEGMPYRGHLLMGYDNLSGEYWSVWMENMSTGVSISRGTMDENGITTMHGTWADPQTPGGRPMRSVTIPVSDDEFRMDFYDTHPDAPGGWFKSMTMTYTRT